MIQAYYTRRHDLLELRVSGHAGAGAKGQDIVCAAVSALTETLAVYLIGAGYGPEVHREPGESVIRCEGIPGIGLLELYDMTFYGIYQISARYPDHVIAEIAEGEFPPMRGSEAL